MLGRLLRSQAPVEERANWSFSQFAGLSPQVYGHGYSPVPVTVQQALSHAASSACVDVLATSVSTLPLDALRLQGRARVPVTPTPSLVSSPSTWAELDVWLYQLLDSMLTDGNAFGLVRQVDARLHPTQIELVAPSVVTNRRVVDAVPEADVDGKPHQLYPHGNLWHVPGKYVRAGSPFAHSPLDRAASTIGAAIAARDFGARFFGDGGHPGAIISSDQDLNSEQAYAIKQAFINAVSGTREPAVLGSGLSYERLLGDVNGEFPLDLMRFAIEEACRFWRVPPSMVYAATSGQNVTYTNATQADLHYLKHSLEGLLVRVERALTRLLPRPQFARFNRNAFLRSDPETRWKIHDLRLRNGSTWVNEVRAIEDEEPIPGDEFDQPGIPIHPSHLPESEGGSGGNTD